MVSKRVYCIFALFGLNLLVSSLALADVYRCPKEDGSVTLSNVEKGANCRKMDLPPPETRKAPPAPKVDKPAPANAEAKPAEKPKTSFESASADRKRVIQEEIDLEKSRLTTVQLRIKDLTAIANKSPDQTKELTALQQKETLHKGNVNILQKELNK